MSEHPGEDPVEHASTKVVSYVSLAAMAAEAIAQVGAARAREQAAGDERAAAALRAERHAAYGQARLGWAPVLDPRLRDRTSVVDAGAAWARAQAWRPDPEAEQATALAEDRLRELRPDVMDRYDRLRCEGVNPVEAMRRVAPFFDQPPARTGEAAPERATLTRADTAARAADAELTLYRGQASVPDDPRSAGVDEHTAAAAHAAPHLTRAASKDTTARAALGPADRTAAVIAGEGYPAPITAGTLDAAKAAATRPVSAGTGLHQASSHRTTAQGAVTTAGGSR